MKIPRLISLCFVLPVACTLLLRAGATDKIYKNDSPKYRAEIEGADYIRVRTGGVPASMHVESKTILEIKGMKAVREFLEPLELFSPKQYATQCNCHGDPTIEIYRDKKLITSLAIQHSVALGWPDRWPAQMVLPNMTIFDKLNEEMAAKGFPQYKEEMARNRRMMEEYIKSEEALKKGEAPIQKLARAMSFGSSEWDPFIPMPGLLSYRDKDFDQITFALEQPWTNVIDPRDLEKSREAIRGSYAANGEFLVEAFPITIGDVIIQWIVTKKRQDNLGFIYHAYMFIFTSKNMVTISIMCQERGTTGMREAIVNLVNIKSAQDAGKPAEEAYLKMRDPYDANHDKGALYMDSDDRKWDAGLPDHPLSRARRKMQAIMDGLAMTEDIKKNALFIKK